MTSFTQEPYVTIFSVLTTELNSLTNDSRALSTAQGSAGMAGHLFGDFELLANFISAPTSDANVDLYLLRSIDDTNYEVGSTFRPSPNAFAGSFTVVGTTGFNRYVVRDVPMPPGLWKALVWNQASGTLVSSGNALRCRAHNIQGT